MRLLSDLFALLCVVACILCAHSAQKSAARAEENHRSALQLLKRAYAEAHNPLPSASVAGEPQPKK